MAKRTFADIFINAYRERQAVENKGIWERVGSILYFWEKALPEGFDSTTEFPYQIPGSQVLIVDGGGLDSTKPYLVLGHRCPLCGKCVPVRGREFSQAYSPADVGEIILSVKRPAGQACLCDDCETARQSVDM